MSDIDPQQFGQLTAQVKRLEQDVTELRHDVKNLIAMLEQSRGSWRTLLMLGGLAAAAGAIIGKVIGWWVSAGPKG